MAPPLPRAVCLLATQVQLRPLHMALLCAGVLVRSVNPTSFAASCLKPDDIVMAFDGVGVASDGTVPFRTGERIAFSYLISTKVRGSDVWQQQQQQQQQHL